MHKKKSSLFLKFLKSFAMLFIISNIFFIDYTLYSQSKQNPVVIENPSATDIYADKQTVEKTQEQVNTLNTKVGNIEAGLSITPVPVRSYYQPQTTAVKEYYISFGTGSSQVIGWADVPGLQSYIDTSVYPNIKTVTFEVGGHTPTGNQIVSVQLFNVTNNHMVANSTVSWAGGGSQYAISSPITLDPGNTLYKIQMNTQVGSQAFVDQARVHIVLY